MAPIHFLLALFLSCQLGSFAQDQFFNVTNDDPHDLWDMIRARLDRYFELQKLNDKNDAL
jgi:hypothetical protein